MYQNHKITPLLSRKVSWIYNRKKFLISNFFFYTFAYRWFSRPRFIRVTRAKILNNFREDFKFCSIILLSIFITANLFDLILNFLPITCSIQNVFYFPPFFIDNDNESWRFINLIGKRVYENFAEPIRKKNVINLH